MTSDTLDEDMNKMEHNARTLMKIDVAVSWRGLLILNAGRFAPTVL